MTTSSLTAQERLTLVDVTPVLRTCVLEAVRTRHAHVGTEHLAIAALEGTLGFVALAAHAGLEAGRLHEQLLACCPERADGTIGEPRPTPRVVRMLAAASQIALIENVGEVRAQHLVRVLLDDFGAVAWAGLAAGGLDPVTARSAYRDLAARARGLGLPSTAGVHD